MGSHKPVYIKILPVSPGERFSQTREGVFFDKLPSTYFRSSSPNITRGFLVEPCPDGDGFNGLVLNRAGYDLQVYSSPGRHHKNIPWARLYVARIIIPEEGFNAHRSEIRGDVRIEITSPGTPNMEGEKMRGWIRIHPNGQFLDELFPEMQDLSLLGAKLNEEGKLIPFAN